MLREPDCTHAAGTEFLEQSARADLGTCTVGTPVNCAPSTLRACKLERWQLSIMLFGSAVEADVFPTCGHVEGVRFGWRSR